MPLFGRKKKTNGKKKPDPKMLGTGGAGQAGRAIKGRQKQLDDIMKQSKKSTTKRKSRMA